MERYLPISLMLDDQLIASDTTVFTAGPRVIVLRTAAAEADLLLYSTYTGHDDLEQALCSELAEIGPHPAQLRQRAVEVGAGAFTYTRRFALYDHLQRLHALCAERLGAELRYERLEAALRELEPTAV